MIRPIKLIMAGALLFALNGLFAEGDAPAPAAEGVAAAPASPFASEKEKLSYAIGMQVGHSLEEIMDEVDIDHVIMAIKDTAAGKGMKMTDEQAMAALQAFSMHMREKMEKASAEEGKKNAAEGVAFLEKNKTAEGVKTTESGLQYQVIKEGDGAKPSAEDTVTVHYKGTLLDGTKFDSSYDRNQPATFPLNGVIPGWTEALQLMKVGSKYKLYIPWQLAYGESGRPPQIPPSSVLVFEVELLKIEPKQ